MNRRGTDTKHTSVQPMKTKSKPSSPVAIAKMRGFCADIEHDNLFVGDVLNPVVVDTIIKETKRLYVAMYKTTGRTIAPVMSFKYAADLCVGRFAEMDREYAGCAPADMVFVFMCMVYMATHPKFRIKSNALGSTGTVDSVWSQIKDISVEWALPPTDNNGLGEWVKSRMRLSNMILTQAAYLVSFVYTKHPSEVAIVSSKPALLLRTMLQQLSQIYHHCHLEARFINESSVSACPTLPVDKLRTWLVRESTQLKMKRVLPGLWECLSPTGSYAQYTRSRNASHAVHPRVHIRALVDLRVYVAFNQYIQKAKSVAQLMSPTKKDLEHKLMGPYVWLVQQYMFLRTFDALFTTRTQESFCDNYWVTPTRIDSLWTRLQRTRATFHQLRCPIVIRVCGRYCVYTAKRHMFVCTNALHALAKWLMVMRDQHDWFTNKRETVSSFAPYTPPRTRK